MGLDGIDEEQYPGSVIALETTTVCEIPFDHLDTLSEELPELLARAGAIHCAYPTLARGLTATLGVPADRIEASLTAIHDLRGADGVIPVVRALRAEALGRTG